MVLIGKPRGRAIMISNVQESCTHACTTQATHPALLGGGFDLMQEFTSITQLQPTNLQDTACRIELADLGSKFPLVKSILFPALCVISQWAIHEQTSNNKWEEEGGWGESKSGGLHVMHPVAAAVCCFVERPHCQALGREIVASACHCCKVVCVALFYSWGGEKSFFFFFSRLHALLQFFCVLIVRKCVVCPLYSCLLHQSPLLLLASSPDFLAPSKQV